MDQYVTSGSIVRDAVSTPSAFISVQARLDQLDAAVRQALDLTSGLTYYPHLDQPMKAEPESERTVIATIDRMADAMHDLVQRLQRVNEVVGGRI